MSFISFNFYLSSLRDLRFALILVLIINCTLVSVSGQEKVYPNMPFKLLRLNNGVVVGIELQAGAGRTIINDSISGRFTGLTLLTGYQVDKNFVVSAGAGISFYRKGALVPLFLDVRYALSLNQLGPYLYADGGLLLNTGNIDNTKVFLNPGIGIQYSASDDLAFVFSTGFWLQKGELKMNTFVNFKTGFRYRF